MFLFLFLPDFNGGLVIRSYRGTPLDVILGNILWILSITALSRVGTRCVVPADPAVPALLVLQIRT